MEKLFASKNIHIVSIKDLYNDERRIAYTSKLLKLNVLINFYGVVVEDKSDVYEEVGIFASYLENDIVHVYVLFISDNVLGPLPIFRLVVDAVDFIENCEAGSVKEDLKAISTFYSSLEDSAESMDDYDNAQFIHVRALEQIKIRRQNLN
ncbi:hypothetical protein [Pedobacter xixiisoli]|uniref:Uncharacterized protein n=1 Tax=Pedobacter xixiisoli TaxID=1476464 RepID=A0A286A703_9SPHI|nr:hypothetical protein [Pedobacter xixiisoli]SOD17713.1 hypothetical protein SAMN06297358_2650 [Pedobacter xixiisoli]